MQNEGAKTPEVITDTPLPLIDSSTINSSTTMSSATPDSLGAEEITPTTIADKQITPLPIASDVIGTSIDTQQRKILGAYQFGQVGALEIGNFVKGQSGDVRISPDGITGRNKQGLTYFTLNEAGLLVTDGSENTIVDAQGIRSTSQFKRGFLQGAPNIITNNTALNAVTVPGTSFSIVTTRDINILFFVDIHANTPNAEFITNGSYIDADLFDSFLGSSVIGVGNPPFAKTTISVPGDGTISWSYTTTSSHDLASAILLVKAGTHNYSLTIRSIGGGNVQLNAWSIGYIILGT